MTDLVATVRLQQSALFEAEKLAMRMGDLAAAARMREAIAGVEFKSEGKRPAMILLTGRARCSCENAEVVAESIAVPYDIDDDRFAWMCRRLLDNLRSEVDAHVLGIGHRKPAKAGKP